MNEEWKKVETTKFTKSNFSNVKRHTIWLRRICQSMQTLFFLSFILRILCRTLVWGRKKTRRMRGTKNLYLFIIYLPYTNFYDIYFEIYKFSSFSFAPSIPCISLFLPAILGFYAVLQEWESKLWMGIASRSNEEKKENREAWITHNKQVEWDNVQNFDGFYFCSRSLSWMGPWLLRARFANFQ